MYLLRTFGYIPDLNGRQHENQQTNKTNKPTRINAYWHDPWKKYPSVDSRKWRIPVRSDSLCLCLRTTHFFRCITCTRGGLSVDLVNFPFRAVTVCFSCPQPKDPSKQDCRVDSRTKTRQNNPDPIASPDAGNSVMTLWPMPSFYVQIRWKL